MAERCVRLLVLAGVLLCLALQTDAQGKRGRGKRPPGGPPKAAAKKPGAAPPEAIIPGFGPSPAAGKKPAGPKGKKPGAPAKGKAGAPASQTAAPADPMTEADRVAEEARARAELESADEKRLKELFRLSDLDQNGWISLREAELVLAFDRAEYGRADADQDGRVVAREFSAQKTLVFARLGAPPPAPGKAPAAVAAPDAEPTPPPAVAGTQEGPRPGKGAGKARAEVIALPGVFPRPTDLLARYDRDHSKALGTEEIERLLAELGLDLSAPLVLAQMDPDESGELALTELLPLSLLASRHMPESMKPGAAPKEAPAPPSGVAAEPAAEPGPRVSALEALTPFGRLDRDKDGFVGEADLAAMQGVARTDARLGALLSALDQDGDRKVSRAEFERAMSGPEDGGR